MGETPNLPWYLFRAFHILTSLLKALQFSLPPSPQPVASSLQEEAGKILKVLITLKGGVH